VDELIITNVGYIGPRRAQGFWRRQFEGAPTRAQQWFDVVFGIVMPIVCFIFDPIVFSGEVEYGDGAIYQQYQFYAYTISAIEMVALCAWLCAAGRASRRPAALAGMLLAGALFAFVVGMAILPYSIAGMLFLLIGVLGFVPFLTALVYLRNAWRAADAVVESGTVSLGRAAVALACGFVFALGAPAVAHVSSTGEALGLIRQFLGH
jgi:hypothetical protein